MSSAALSKETISDALVAAAGASTSVGLLPSSTQPFQFGHLITMKLTQENYLLWRAQVLPLLRSNSLMGYVDGSFPCSFWVCVLTSS
jgi:hypothetical protein